MTIRSCQKVGTLDWASILTFVGVPIHFTVLIPWAEKDSSQRNNDRDFAVPSNQVGMQSYKIKIQLEKTYSISFQQDRQYLFIIHFNSYSWIQSHKHIYESENYYLSCDLNRFDSMSWNLTESSYLYAARCTNLGLQQCDQIKIAKCL